MKSYMIKRLYRNDIPPLVVKRGLTLQEAREHCADPETSSSTAKSVEAEWHTRISGPWFEGYTEE